MDFNKWIYFEVGFCFKFVCYFLKSKELLYILAVFYYLNYIYKYITIRVLEGRGGEETIFCSVKQMKPSRRIQKKVYVKLFSFPLIFVHFTLTGKVVEESKKKKDLRLVLYLKIIYNIHGVLYISESISMIFFGSIWKFWTDL